MVHFFINIGLANYNQGFINIPVDFQIHFGADRTSIVVSLGNLYDNKIIQAIVDRHNTPNGTPRIQMGILYTNWVQANHTLNQQLHITINPAIPGHILIQ
jgi:hypothetical protein